MGWKAFTNGLNLYFKEFKWTNANLKDFMGKLQQGYEEAHAEEDGAEKLNLQEWSDQWLKTKGPNKITYKYTHNKNIITQFKIRQGFLKNSDEIFRKQSFCIGFFEADYNFEEYFVTIQNRELTDLP